jgi:hypothetical protein
MSMRRLFLMLFGAAVFTALLVPTSAQMADQTASEQVRNAVRSQLHLKSDQFLGVQRDEELEQLLALAMGKPRGLAFIYKVSQAGDEVKENAVVHHIFTDVDPTYIIAVNPTDGSTYRIHGFADSLDEFGRLMTATKTKVLSPDQAEAVSDFYLEVNPQHASMIPITSLLELKQAAERQCQTSSFDTGEREFDAWWKHGKLLYAGVPFRQTATASSSGYIVEWTILSSSAPGNCGGAPLRASLEVEKDGQVGKLAFTTLRSE